MQWRSILAFSLILVLGIGVVAAAFDGSGGVSGAGKPSTKCNDGKDNDGDGLIDSASVTPSGEDPDPGCTEPAYYDNSEGNIYDLDASWIFGHENPNSTGPSIFYGAEVVQAGANTYEDGALSSSEKVNETYVKDSDENWGGGRLKGTTITIPEGATIDRGGSQFELIDTPRDEGKFNCGDADQDSGENTLSCPDDMGLPEDIGNSDANTISDVLGTYDTGTGDSGDETTDDVKYVMDLEASEFETVRLPSHPKLDDATPTCTASSCSDQEKVYEDQDWISAPDFFVKSGSELWMVYPEVVGKKNIENITDKGLVKDTYTDYDYAGDDYTSCTPLVKNAECWSSTVCTEIDNDNVYNRTLDTDGKDITGTSQSYSTDKSGSLGWSEVTDEQTFRVHVTWNIETDKADWTELEADNCLSTGTNYTCSKAGGCDLGDKKRVYTSGSSMYYSGYDSAEKAYYYEDVELNSTRIFDLNPAENPHSISSERALFEGDTFERDDEWDSSETVSLSLEGAGYFSWAIDFTDRVDQGNDHAVSQSKFVMETDSDDKFVSRRTFFQTFDADGWNGQADGYVAIDDGAIVGVTEEFLTREVKDGLVVDDYVSTSDVPVPECPGPHTKCVASVDVSLDDLNEWDTLNPNTGLDFGFVPGNPFELDKSLGVCKMYKELSGDTQANCQYDTQNTAPTSDDGTDGDNGGACGDEPNEYWAYMEGPEIDESVMDDNPGHYEACINKKTQCVLRGNAVNEGTVANVAPEHSNDQYEAGGNSPDWEVCLYKGGQIHSVGDDRAGDNQYNSFNQEDYGGEWYDLDSEEAQEYLRNGGSDLVENIGPGNTKDGSIKDSNGDGTSDSSDIDYYWRQNLNPSHSTYNPEGSTEGTALEDDCGNPRFSSDNLQGCNDAGQRYSSGDERQPTFYSFLMEGKRDEDYQPQGDDIDTGNAVFRGYIIKLTEMSNQLEAGMDTSNFYTSTTPNPSIWSNSDGSDDAADQWAIAQSFNWSLSSRGVPYPPWNTYYRSSSSKRSSPDSTSRLKTQKVFGNSYAAVSDTSMTDDNGNSVDPGDGVWIDPDFIRTAWNSGNFRWGSSTSTWTDTLTFKMDLTGPDSGVGFDTGDGSDLNFKGSSGNEKAVLWGDIYFQGEKDNIDNDGNDGTDEGPSQENWEGTNDVGETVPEHEPPMCGDDQKEFLLEEMGESIRSEQFNGMYACARTANPCVDMSSTPRIRDYGSYTQTDEPDEEVGRLKNDFEICEQRPEDDMSLWYDQDFGHIDSNGIQDTCNTNLLYGKRGLRWVDAQYVKDYPKAVTGGIDDDWNMYIDNNYNSGKSDEFTQKYASKPNQDNWNFATESPVDSGARPVGNDSIATLGFCGGDDAGEHLITQQCNTNLCETDRDILGVTKTPGSCVLEPSTFDSGYSIDTDERKLYAPGEKVEVDIGSDTRKIACFNGYWYEDWPIVFKQDEVQVPFGETSDVAFSVINVRESRTTFKVEMIDPFTDNPSAYQHSTFVEKDGDSFETTIAPQSSKTFHIEIRGADKAIGDDSEPSEDDLTVRASASNSDMTGQDVTTVDIVQNNATNSSVGRTEPRSVPGIGMIHIIFLILMSSAVFFLQS